MVLKEALWSKLKGVLPKDYAHPRIDKQRTGQLMDLNGRIYDPCCGSGGMFVQSEKFVIAYGQESHHITWRLAKMNLANPPFNHSDWDSKRLTDYKSWK